MAKLFIIVNQDSFFLSHRKPVAQAALSQGYDVTIVAQDTGRSADIRALGLGFVDLPIDKAGVNPVKEASTFWFLYRLFRQEKPDIVHNVGLKAILWGGLAARLAGVRGIVSAVSGLGVLFSPDYPHRSLRMAVTSVLKYIHRSEGVCCIFHNLEDRDVLLKAGVVNEQQCFRTMGSGIDLEEYAYCPEPAEGKMHILFTARMVEDKGVLVLIDAASRLKEEFGESVDFLLCGGLDTNPNAITKEQLESLCDGTYIKWLGMRNDVLKLLRESHIFAFPSYYKEGLPKSCIEAAAVGRPVVTCDSTGCRDAVEDGVTGFLVPVKDSEALAERLRWLITHPQERKMMGEAARAFAEKTFSIKEVVDIHMDIYRRILR
ncbi:MAG: glycosyltransferase family 4 protein [Bacteroidales bacterium]|nr:glycosyltransferase family 4 protein [Bacteroidales bacterium]